MTLLLIILHRSSRCLPSQVPVTVNSYTSNHEKMDERDDQQQDATEPYYDQPEKIIVSHAHSMCMHNYYDSNCINKY